MGWLSDFFGKGDRTKAREAARLADAEQKRAEDINAQQLALMEQQRAANQVQIDRDQSRWDEYYAPMEQRLVEELGQGPDLEGEASLARNRFGNEFDQSAGAARRQAMRLGIQPGSEQTRRTEDANTYNRARGMADAANTARREEDDAHFIREAAFFGQQGSGLKQQILSNINNSFGIQDSQLQNQGAFAGNNRDYHQGVSDQYAAESNSGFNTLLGIGGQVVQGIASGGVSIPLQGALSGFFNRSDTTGTTTTPTAQNSFGVLASDMNSAPAQAISQAGQGTDITKPNYNILNNGAQQDYVSNQGNGEFGAIQGYRN